MKENQRRVYHYLHNQAQGVVIGEWDVNKEEFRFTLPLGPKRDLVHYNFNKNFTAIDPRDKRTMVVFDGQLPYGGLPKNSIAILSEHPSIYTRIQNFRKCRGGHDALLSSKYILSEDNKEVRLEIDRCFLLLPKSVACVRKYDSRSLRPIYVMIEVDEKGVTWRTSSY